MEYRKLISFGKSSYVVSLPKAWITKQKLKKGDTLYFDEKDNDLILRSKEPQDQDEEKELTINIDGKTINQIQRELIPAYINNNKTIILFGKEIKDKAKVIEPIIQNLIALEIMEQNAHQIVAKDFLNMRDISINNLFRKMDIITRAMLEDCENMFNEDTYENINHRDRDVNRLSYLIFRVVYYGLENQVYMNKQFKFTVHDLLRYHLSTFHLEAIADEVRRIARYMCLIKLSKDSQKHLINLLDQLKKNYLDTMKAFYNHDLNLAYSVAEKKPDLMKSCENFYLKNQKTPRAAHLINHFKRMINVVHKLGRLIYQ